MAGKMPSFVNGSNVIIKIGDLNIALCQGLQFQRNVTNTPVRGIGSFSVHALEPTDYSASGSMSIMRYNNTILGGSGTDVPDRTAKRSTLPEVLSTATTSTKRDGNSLLTAYTFDPRRILLSTTFDIEVYERGYADDKGTLLNAKAMIYKFHDCRLTNYSFSFAPGQLLVENVDFLCRYIEDVVSVDLLKDGAVG
jgi:hypothetical protein